MLCVVCSLRLGRILFIFQHHTHSVLNYIRGKSQRETTSTIHSSEKWMRCRTRAIAPSEYTLDTRLSLSVLLFPIPPLFPWLVIAAAHFIHYVCLLKSPSCRRVTTRRFDLDAIDTKCNRFTHYSIRFYHPADGIIKVCVVCVPQYIVDSPHWSSPRTAPPCDVWFTLPTLCVSNDLVTLSQKWIVAHRNCVSVVCWGTRWRAAPHHRAHSVNHAQTHLWKLRVFS